MMVMMVSNRDWRSAFYRHSESCSMSIATQSMHMSARMLTHGIAKHLLNQLNHIVA